MRDEKLRAVVARSTFGSQTVECREHLTFGPLLEVEMSKKCMPLWREAHFEVKMRKAHKVWSTFGSWDVEKVRAVVAPSTFPSQNVKSTTCSDHFWRFRCGCIEEDLERCISRGRRNTRDVFIRDARRSGRWFPERGCILEHQIFSFGKMILRDRCNTLDRWSGQIAKRIGTRPSALLSMFEGSLRELLRFWCCQLR